MPYRMAGGPDQSVIRISEPPCLCGHQFIQLNRFTGKIKVLINGMKKIPGTGPFGEIGKNNSLFKNGGARSLTVLITGLFRRFL